MLDCLVAKLRRPCSAHSPSLPARLAAAFSLAALLLTAPAHAQAKITAFGVPSGAQQDQTVFAPGTTTLTAVITGVGGYITDWIKITVDGTDYNATLGNGGMSGTITWNTAGLPNPSEHFVSASAQLHQYTQITQLNSLNPAPPPTGPYTGSYGDGRAADVIVANLQMQSLTYTNGALTLEQNATTPVPVPQVTWAQASYPPPTTNASAGYVMGATPSFLGTLYQSSGGVPTGVTMTATATPNTGDPVLTLKNTGNTPIPFSGTSFTVTSDVPLLSKVAYYGTTFSNLGLWVKFQTGKWGAANGFQPFSNVFYATLAQPTAPMSSPWANVLWDACNWAAGTSSVTAAGTNLTKGLFFSQQFYYPGDSTTWWIDPFTKNFELSNFLSTSGYKRGNCQDVSDFLTICANAIGINFDVTQYSYTANPTGKFTTNLVCLIGSDPTQGYAYSTKSWTWHQIASPSGSTSVYDVCAAQWLDLFGAAYQNPPCGWPLNGFWQTIPSLGLVASPNPDSPVFYTQLGYRDC